ncbi:MAG: septum formation protein Maf [Bacteriovoracaceae bacterium]|nr:septum formation protein Maf [Bacteriovoracaceae bacterium]
MKEKNKLYTLVLGSKSPRREELLGWTGLDFKIKPAHIDEKSLFNTPREIAQDIAARKGEAVMKECLKIEGTGKNYFPLVVASDTIVCIGDEILGKPGNIDEAKKMLLKLSGTTHLVITAVWFGRLDIETGRELNEVFSSETDVTFRDIDDDLLERYLDSEESLDKAGAYGIQGQALTFVSHINGSYSNVVGFPLDEMIFELKNFLNYSDDFSGEWRKLFCGKG